MNKAGQLIADGGNFNGYTIKGLGLAKLGKITWSLQNLITSGADYKDIFYTYPLACRKNVGRAGTYITEADCQEVDKVVRATEMFKDPSVGAPVNVDYCPSGQDRTTAYTQGFETKVADWTWGTNWVLGSSVDFRYAAVGKDSAVAWVFAGDNTSLTQNNAIAVTNGTYLRFDQSYLFDTGDMGRVEYSVNGTTWLPAQSLPNVGGSATFTGVSNGYAAARYDLSSLAGQNVKIRFRATAVTNNSAWWVDNAKFYTCG
jgi:bacillolysin